MTELTAAFGDAVGEFLAHPIVVLAFQMIAAYVVVIWLAAAYWAFRDMERRSGNVIAPYVSAAAIILFTPLLFPAAVILHKVARPPSTLAEEADEELRRTILEAEARGHQCPACQRDSRPDWRLCPHCGARLRRSCPDCDTLVELDWDLCAWCGSDFRPAIELADGPAPLAFPVRRPVPVPARPLAGREPVAVQRSVADALRPMALAVREVVDHVRELVRVAAARVVAESAEELAEQPATERAQAAAPIALPAMMPRPAGRQATAMAAKTGMPAPAEARRRAKRPPGARLARPQRMPDRTG